MMIVRARRSLTVILVGLLAMAAPALAALPKVPDGFKAKLVATVPAVMYPSQVATAPDGSLFVAEDPMDQVGPYEADNGRILLFREGKEPVVYASGFRPIFGMAWHDGKLYVMNMPYLTTLKDTNGDGKADERNVLFTDLGLGPKGFNDHIVSGIQFGIDGWLYISVGDKGVPGVHGKDGRYAQVIGGGTLRCRPDGTGIEVYTTGTRNHLEVNLDERDNLFTYDNTDDGLGWWTRVTHHIDGGYYGYPYDYHDRNDRHLPRMAEYGGGSPCGGILYKEDYWPAEYRGRGYWAEWGKRHVAAIKFEPSGSSFKVTDYLKFVEPASGESINPLDLALSYDGKTLYVADWGMGGWGSKTEKVGRIYAITYVGKSDAKARGKDSDPIPAQIQSLAHASFNERVRAQHALIHKGKAAFEPAVKAMNDPKTSPVAKRHLVWVIDGIARGSTAGEAALTSALKSDVADVRAQAARAMGLRETKTSADALIGSLKDSDPGVKLQAIIALGRIKDARAIPVLIPALVDADPYIAYSARIALRRIRDWKAAVAGISPSTDVKTRQAVLLALEEQYDVDAVNLLKTVAADKTRSSEERAKALFYLAQGHRKKAPWDGNWWGTRPAAGKEPAKVVVWDGTNLVVDAVVTTVGDSDAKLRQAAVVAIREMNDKATASKLRDRFLTETDASVQREIATTLGAFEDKAAIPLLIAALRDSKSPDTVREASLSAIEKIGSDAATKSLIELLAQPDLSTDRQARVIGALGRTKTKSALPIISKLLTSKDAKVRTSAVEAIGAIGDAKASEQVRPLLKDPVIEVRKASIVALGRLKDRVSIPTLITLANEESTRFEATMALTAIPDLKALQVYLSALADKSPDLRKAANVAMLEIREQAVPVLEQLAKRKELAPAALPELRKIFAALEPIAKWHVIGPFKLSERPPVRANSAIDIKTPVVIGDGKKFDWKEVKAISLGGEIDLNRLYNGTDNSAAFAYAEFDSPTERTTRMAVGSDDTLQVWLNGRPVYKFDENRSYSAESASVEVKLNKGKNKVFIRCGNTSGGWAYSVAFSGSKGEYAFLQAPSEAGFNPDKFKAVALLGKGKADHGKALFSDLKGVACIKCHAVAGKGGLVGPELSAVGIKYPREELITSVLYPSQKISSGYEPIVIALADGKVVTGILKSETPEALEIEDADAKRVKIIKADIDGRKTSEVSLMPNGLAEGLSASDFADLIAYLETLKDTAALHAPPGGAVKPK
jgi:putative membrane-bound dehydrogenase-like protein